MTKDTIAKCEPCVRRCVTVLLLAAGSPGDYHIIKGLKQSKRYDVTLHAADCDPMKGNLYLPEVDKRHIVPSYDAPGYHKLILGLAKKIGAEVLISDLDEELPALSSAIEIFKDIGCNIVLPKAEALAVSLDKMATYDTLLGRVRQPYTICNSDDPNFDMADDMVRQFGRLVLKPRFLRGGRGIEFMGNKEEMEFYRIKNAEWGPCMIQEYIEGDEYNVSTLHDMSGRLVYAAARIKLERRMNKSNTIAAKVVEAPDIRECALCAIRALGLGRGFNNVEAIVRDGVPYVIDVNGGRWAGQDMNLLYSGINQAELYLDLALGEFVWPIEVPVGAISLKIKHDIVIGEKTLYE